MRTGVMAVNITQTGMGIVSCLGKFCCLGYSRSWWGHYDGVL